MFMYATRVSSLLWLNSDTDMWVLSLTYLKRGNRHGWLLPHRYRLVSDLPLVIDEYA